MTFMIEVVRSPAKVAWWVKVNGSFLTAFDRKREADAFAISTGKKYGLDVHAIRDAGRRNSSQKIFS